MPKVATVVALTHTLGKELAMSKTSKSKKPFHHKKGIRIGHGPFDYVPNTEGVDDTFEVVCTTTDMVVARFRYWDGKVAAELKARNMALTLNALRENMIEEQEYDDGTAWVCSSVNPSSIKMPSIDSIGF